MHGKFTLPPALSIKLSVISKKSNMARVLKASFFIISAIVFFFFSGFTGF